MRPKASPLAIWGALVVLYLVWGSTYLGMKVAIETMPPLVMGAFRFIPAGVLLALFVVIRERGRIRRPSAREIRDAAIVGALLLVGGTGLVAWAEQTIPTGVAAVVIALVPMWLAVLGFVIYREPVRPLLAVGIAVGLVGVAILAWPAGGAGDLDPAGLAAILVAPVCWALGTLYAARRAVLPGPGAARERDRDGGRGPRVRRRRRADRRVGDVRPGRRVRDELGGIGYLIVMGSLVGYRTFAWLITVAPLSRVSTYAYVNPVVAVLLGWLVLGEPLTLRTIVASVVIVVAVALIVSARTGPRGRGPGGTRHAPAPRPARPVRRPGLAPAPSRRPSRRASPRPDADPRPPGGARPPHAAPRYRPATRDRCAAVPLRFSFGTGLRAHCPPVGLATSVRPWSPCRSSARASTRGRPSMRSSGARTSGTSRTATAPWRPTSPSSPAPTRRRSGS